MIKKLLPHFSFFWTKKPIIFQNKTCAPAAIQLHNSKEAPASVRNFRSTNIPSDTQWKLALVAILFFMVSFVNAATRMSTATGGNWATGSTWVGGVAPVVGDEVIIATTGISTVVLGANASIVNVTINTGATLNIGARILTATGFFVNNGLLTGTSGTLTLTGNFTNSSTFTLTTGRLTITAGNFNNAGNFTLSGAGRLSLAGNYSTSGTVTLGSSAVQFTGTANQSIQGFTTTGTVSMLKTGGVATLTGNMGGSGLTISGLLGTLHLGIGLTHTFTGSWTRTAGTLNGGSSLFKLGRNANGSGGFFVSGSGTVEYTRAGIQTVGVAVYNNLTLSGTSAKTAATSPTVNGKLTLAGTANVSVTTGVITYGPNATLEYNKASVYTATSEEWVSPFTGRGGVIIANLGTITLNLAKVFDTEVPLTINNNAKLTTNNLSMTFGGNFVNNGGIFTAGSSPIAITSNMASQSISGYTTTGLTTVTKTGGTATFTSAINAGALTINGASGTLNLGSGLLHALSGVVTLTNGTLHGGSSTLEVKASSATAWSGSGTNFIAGTGTVNFSGAAQILATASTFNNLTFSNSGTKNLIGLPTINGVLSMEGTATVSVLPIYGPSATLQYNRTVAQGSGLEWRTPFVAAGGVRIVNTGVITTVEGKTFNAAIPLRIQSGATLDNGGFSISGSSTLTVEDSGTLKVSGLGAFPVFTTTTLGATSTVIYTGAAQNVAVKDYGNLTLTGSGTKTVAGSITIVGAVEISGSAVAIFPNNSISTAQSLTFGGVLQNSGSWGGSSSFATNKEATRFGSSSTGILNVSITCVVGTWLGIFSSDWNFAGNWCGGNVPSNTTDVVISTAPNQPIIGLAGGFCKNLNINNGSNLTISGNNAITVSGNWVNNGTFTANTSTVNLIGTGTQSLGGSAANIFHNLTNLNTTSAVDVVAALTVKEILHTAGNSVLQMNTFTLIDGGTFSNSGSGQIRTSNIGTVPIPAGKTWTTTITYDTATGGQTIIGGTYNGFPSLVLNNTSGTQTAAGAIITGNQLNIDNGGTPTFAMNGHNLSIGILNMTSSNAVLDVADGNFSIGSVVGMEGTVQFSGTNNGHAFATGTVEYYGAGQTVATGTYNNLLFSGLTGSYSIVSDIDISDALTVTNGAVTVQEAVAVAVGNAVTVIAPGTLTLENNASLLQTTYTGANIGNIVVKRNSTPILLDDFTYWSSPTSGTQTLLDFSPNTQNDKYFSFNNNWINVNPATTFFTPGIGYAIRSSETSSTVTPAADTSLQFLGVPNNGTIAVSVTSILENGEPAGLRLIGNPYPSSIDADAFIDANSVSGTGTQTITGTLYFWTHNHRISGNVYDGDIDYAVYTKAGGVGTFAAGGGTGNNSIPTGDIASGQGFFVEVDVTGDVVFNNDMRVTASSSTNSNFYKQTATKKINNNDDEERNRIWLNLTNASKGSQTLVSYMADATNDYDKGYDGLIFDDGSPFVLYSVLGNDKLAIQARTEFSDTDVVPLGYAINEAGNATITLDHEDGLFLYDQNIYLEDKVLNLVHNLKEEPYHFSSQKGTFNERFALRFTDRTLATTDFDSKDSSVLIINNQNELKVKSQGEIINKITVFDVLGRKLFQETVINTNEFQTTTSKLSKQVVVIQVTLANGKVITKKVVF